MGFLQWCPADAALWNVLLPSGVWNISFVPVPFRPMRLGPFPSTPQPCLPPCHIQETVRKSCEPWCIVVLSGCGYPSSPVRQCGKGHVGQLHSFVATSINVAECLHTPVETRAWGLMPRLTLTGHTAVDMLGSESPHASSLQPQG